MRALLLVDLQRDFLPGGALAVPRGDEVIPVANRLQSLYRHVVASKDWHPANHKSFAANHPGRAVGDVVDVAGLEQILWPVHCVQGQIGATYAPGLRTESIEKVILKGTDPEIDSYSAFFDNARRQETGLDSYLRATGIEEIDILGLALDYCVRATALDAAERGFHCRIIVDGCRAVELVDGDSARALEAMRAAGVQVVTSTEIETELASQGGSAAPGDRPQAPLDALTASGGAAA